MINRFAILIPNAAIADFEALRKKASELAQRCGSMFWWSPRGAEIAFCFEKHGAAGFFQIYCVNEGIQNRPEWPETVEYRVATREDETDILAVLKEAAPEVPFSLDTTKKEDILKIVIRRGCDSGQSWVAVDADTDVVGVVLITPNLAERALERNDAVDIPYVAVAKNRRKRGVFGNLMEKAMAKGDPMNATVLHGNKSGMVDCLEKLGFKKVESESDDEKTKLRWKSAPDRAQF